MYKLKNANVRRVVSTEAERDKLIREGYTLYGEDIEECTTEEDVQEEIEEPIEETIIEDREEKFIEEIEESIENAEETEEHKEAKKGRGRNGK